MNIRRMYQFTISGLSLLGICLTAASTGQAQWVQSGSNMYYTKGNISVGTTTPFGQFTIGNYTLGYPYGSFIFNQGAFTLKGLKNSNYFPYLEFRDENNARASYLGWGSKSGKYLDWQFENGYNLAIKGGKVGIGTAPLTKFHIKGSTAQDAILFIQPGEWNSAGDYGELRFGDTNHYIRGEYLTGMTLYDANKFQFMGGNVGIKTTNPQAALHVNGNVRLDGYRTYFGLDGSKHHWLALNKGNETSNLFMAFTSNDGIQAESVLIAPKGISGLIVRSTGNVGIGTYDPGSYRLAVNGTIRAKEVIVNTGWADFVFNQNYQLMPLSEVEQRVKADKHLPGIPSAKEIEANGVSVGDMQAKQLQKIEELTLYMIEMNKQLSALQQENARLNAEINALKQSR